MVAQECCDANERELARERSIRLIYLMPLPGSKSRPPKPSPGTWSPEEYRDSGLVHSSGFDHMIPRSQTPQGPADADPEPAATTSFEDRDNIASSPGIDPTQNTGVGFIDSARGIVDGNLSSSPAVVEALPELPIIAFGVYRQPPAEIRTNCPLPTIVVSLKRLQVQPGDSMTLDDNSLWGQASLVSADGRVAMAQFRADILTGGSLVAPLLRSPLHFDDGNWSFTFGGLVIREPGYFKIRIALIRTSQSEGQTHGSPVMNAPREQLSIDTRLIRVHAFAPALRDTSKRPIN